MAHSYLHFLVPASKLPLQERLSNERYVPTLVNASTEPASISALVCNLLHQNLLS